jgi:hypothetical protein
MRNLWFLMKITVTKYSKGTEDIFLFLSSTHVNIPASQYLVNKSTNIWPDV